tara:strand:+ start:1553 stop:1954 length:402 start_codon:yes stop_codon:yes gene_type:complete
MTRMTEKSEYSYSIQNLQQSIGEAMAGEYTPQEIHEVIIDSVKDNMRYYRACYNDSVRLLALLKGNTNKDIKVHDEEWRKVEDPSYTENDYWEGKLSGTEFQEALQKYGFEYTPIDKKFKLDSPELHNDEDED